MLNPSTENLEEYEQLIIGKCKTMWILSYSNELGKLVQGVKEVNGTKFVTFIHHSQVTKGKNMLMQEHHAPSDPKRNKRIEHE